MLETAFHFAGSPVSWLETIAFVLALAMVICSAYEHPATWPLAIVSSALYVWLFYVNKLYGETIVNVFFVLSGAWGWFQWLFGHRKHSREPLRVAALDARGVSLTLIGWIAGWIGFALFLKHFTDSTVPWADAFVTAGSFTGTILLARKYIENWPVWLVVNAASVALFIYKALWLTTLLYAILLAFSFFGWYLWRKALTSQTQ